MAKRGRKSAWDTKIAPNMELILELRAGGHSYREICFHIGVGVQTFLRYLAENQEFRESLILATQHFDDEVISSLYQQCVGYEYDEITRERAVKPSGEVGMVETKRVTKFVQPSVGAICFYLANRRPDEWKQRVTAAINGDGVLKVQLPDDLQDVEVTSNSPQTNGAQHRKR